MKQQRCSKTAELRFEVSGQQPSKNSKMLRILQDLFGIQQRTIGSGCRASPLSKQEANEQ
jgi:hypothetical protein